MLGPIFLLSPLALLLLGNPALRPIALAGLLFLLPYPANVGTRFLIPAAPFFALGIGILCSRIDRLAVALALLHAVLSWPAAIPLYAAKYAWRLDSLPWKYALHLRPDDEYILKRMGVYAITREIDRVVPQGKRVLGFDQIPEAYTKAEFLVGFQSATGDNLVEIFHSAIIPERRAVGRTMFRFPRQKLQRVRLVQNTNLPEERWSVAELRVRNKGQQVERQSNWRLRSSPNPWDVGSAFDNSPVTRWSSWEPRKAGMFIEVEFPAPLEADEVLLEISRDQTLGQMTVEGYDSYGNHYILSSNPIETEIAPQVALRLAATQELLRRGIDYILLFDNNYGYEDVRRNARYWGLELVSEKGNARLYRLLGKIPEEAKP